MKKIMLLCLIFLIIMIAGCAGTSPTDIAKGTQMAQSFLNEYPNANIVAAYFNEASMQSLLPDLQQKCGTQITSSDYYKVSITDVSKNLDVVVWVDAKSQTPVCAIRTAPNSTVIQPNPGQSNPPSTETGLPDLIVSSFDMQPESPTTQQDITLNITLKNIGTATAYPVIYVIYNNDGSAGISNSNEPPLSLEPGKTMTYNIFGGHGPAGNNLIKVAVNPILINGSRLVQESNYDNNIAEKQITIIEESSKCVPKNCDPINCRVQSDGCGGTLNCVCRSGLVCTNAEGICKIPLNLSVLPAGSGTFCANGECTSDNAVVLVGPLDNIGGVHVEFFSTYFSGYSFSYYDIPGSVGSINTTVYGADNRFSGEIIENASFVAHFIKEAQPANQKGFAYLGLQSPWTVTPEGNVMLKLQNKVGQRIVVNKIYASRTTSGVCSTGGVSIDTGQIATVSCQTPITEISGTSGTDYDLLIMVEYTVPDTGLVANDTGTILGKY